MANAFTVPFNFHIASSDNGDTGTSYTCPSGKRARVVATLYVNADGRISNTTTNGNATSNSNSTTVELWVDDGDVVSATASAASATDSASTAPALLTGDSTATLSVNDGGGVITAAELKATASCSDNASSGTVNLSVGGTADVRFYVEEYQNIT